ncbi:hypothetical protein Tco_0145792 [Tanacetum coccineum]
MGDENPIRTLGDYSKPSHEGYRNTIELPIGNNVVPLRSDTIRLVQNGCSFHRLRSEDPNQHLKDFLKLVDSLNLDSANRERKRLQEINDRMAEMFGLLKDLTTSRAPKKEEERSGKYNEAIDNNIEKPTMTKTEMPAEKENEAENGIENEPTRKAKKEEIVEAPSS